MTGTLGKIRELLGQIGSTPHEVAETLGGRNITGPPEDPHCCPIACLILTDIPGAANWAMEDFAVQDDFITTPEGKVTVPPPVATFIREFDEGVYPELQDDPDPEGNE